METVDFGLAMLYKSSRPSGSKCRISGCLTGNTVISEDSGNISKGQKQLLTIARAMLYNSKMLIWDKATSNVDTSTEREVQKAMRKLMKGKTCFVIAHRLSTIANADLILVVNHGDVVEQGTHESLMAKKGFYYQLYAAQFE